MSLPMPSTFTPPIAIRNGHVQTVLTSLRLRKYLTQRRATKLLSNEEELILNCGDGVRLLGHYTRATGHSRGLVTLIHGWEGSSYSSYILSAAHQLYTAGFSVFRLNLRDHGESHHLNQHPFNSSRLNEVRNAIVSINTQFPQEKCFIAGFSLGGNFALRIAASQDSFEQPLSKVVAISPLINPLTTTTHMEVNHKVYHYYFLKKWKRSLQKKMELFPELDDMAVLTRLGTLREMHDYFVPRHTGSSTTPEYFKTYTLCPEDFTSLTTPTNIINAEDDPITEISELKDIENTNIPMLEIKRVPFGGHCGFLKNLQLHSWVDNELVRIFSDSE